MTVKWFESGTTVTRMPYAAEYQEAMSRLSAGEIATIKAALNDMIDKKTIHTSGWMPGADWSGTPFSPIYSEAARGSYERSAQIFGLVVFETFMERPEVWFTGRFEKDGVPIGSRTYFQAG